ncbi:MAG TPA: porin [Ramlibacter sp.]|uniref:porin n=1 Tax=Ramlibacter sp. TaxID=1917967 RepID=UPI002D807A1E|nr:porin [Ramlibacter sp.]HET8748306.1 porin [Ramlibacter sp.]
MKKSLIALAVMAAAGAASAQSSVTLFGIVDATIAYGRASGPGNDSKTALTNSGYNSSRLGFRGVEDLGGGMSASFWLEGSLGNDDGTTGQRIPTTNRSNVHANDGAGLVFNRRSTVSLSGGWGEVRLGRDYTPSFWNLTVFDPFGTNGVGTTLTLGGPGGGLGAGANTFVPVGTRGVLVRASNDIGYFLPANLGGIYGQINFWHGDDAAPVAGERQSDGTGAGLRLGYGAGPFNVAAAWARTKYDAGDYTTWNIGGSWDFGVAKAMAQYTRDQKDSPVEIDGRGWLIGALVPVGAGEIRASYSTYKIDFGVGGDDPKARQVALGYVHNLSKRTAIYTTVAHVRNDNGARVSLNGAVLGAGNDRNSTGFDLGIRHSF